MKGVKGWKRRKMKRRKKRRERDRGMKERERRLQKGKRMHRLKLKMYQEVLPAKLLQPPFKGIIINTINLLVPLPVTEQYSPST